MNCPLTLMRPHEKSKIEKIFDFTVEEWNNYGISVLDIGNKKCGDELSFVMDAISVSPKKCIYICL